MVRILIAAVLVVMLAAVAPASAQSLGVYYTSQCVSLGPGNGNKVVTATRATTNDGVQLRVTAGLVATFVSCNAGGQPIDGGSACKMDGPTGVNVSGERITFVNGNFMTYHKVHYGPPLTEVANFTRNASCPDIAVCGAYGCSYPANSPIIVPTERLAKQQRTFTVSGTKKGAAFDINGDGVIDIVGWPEGGAAFLAIDHNGNGVIDDGKELLGTANGYDNGFAELKARATALGGGSESYIGADNITAPLFAQLLLWEDRNRDGLTDQGEVRPASELLKKIGLGWFGPFSRHDEHGNDFRYDGWAEYKVLKPQGSKANLTGDIYAIWDVFLVQQ